MLLPVLFWRPGKYLKEGRMSYLRNPSFENGTNFWNRINHAGSVTFSVGPSANPPPVTGANIASIVSLVSGGSIGQDVSGVNAASVSCFAHVTSVTGSDGTLAIWNLSTGVASSTPFTVQNSSEFQLVMNTLDIGGTADLRVEIYLNTPGGQLSIDYVNLF
jgi:hypothetical protein